MTTIAFKDGLIAYDSRCTQDQTIVDDNHNKKVTVEKVHFFFSGALSDYNDFIESYFGKKPEYKLSCSAFVCDKGKVYKCGVDNEIMFWKVLIEVPASIGSGQDHAITAMDMGADAKTAVKMAIKRDSGSGGRVRVFKL